MEKLGHQTLCHPLHPQCTNYLFWLKKTLSSLSIISFPQVLLNNKYMSRWVDLTFPFSPKHCHYAPCFPNISPSALYLLPGMPVTPRADKISHGLASSCVTFTHLPWYHSLHSSHLIMNSPIYGFRQTQWSLSLYPRWSLTPPFSLVYPVPLMICWLSFWAHSGTSRSWHNFNLSWLAVIITRFKLYFIEIGGQLFNYHSRAFPRGTQFSSFSLNSSSVQLIHQIPQF